MTASEALTGILAIVLTALLVALRRVLRRRRTAPAPPPREAPLPPAPRSSRPSLPPRRVLVVDDEPGLARALARQLRHELAVDAEHAETGEEALAMVAACPVDLLVVDIGLRGGISGAEVVRHLRAEGHAFAVLVISAIDAEDLERVAETLAARALAKPFDLGPFVETCRELLR